MKWWGAVVWWAYSSRISLTVPRVEGSLPGLSDFFRSTDGYAVYFSEEIKFLSLATRKRATARRALSTRENVAPERRRERRNKMEKPAGERGTKYTNKGRWFGRKKSD